MDEETRQRIFEPFFTTKNKDRGTGLGLAMVYGIVKQLGGYIIVYSEVGQGTTFNIYLPAAREKTQIEKPEPPAPIKAESARILLVEDEVMLQKLFKRVLEMAGHEVTACQNPKEALLAVNNGPSYSLVVSDVVLPGISGPELVDQIKARTPETKSLFISGYTEHVTLQSLRRAAGEEFLQKPFTTAELTDKVNRILSGEKQRK
jgi:CheY-like chemotaxis protein